MPWHGASSVVACSIRKCTAGWFLLQLSCGQCSYALGLVWVTTFLLHLLPQFMKACSENVVLTLRGGERTEEAQHESTRSVGWSPSLCLTILNFPTSLTSHAVGAAAKPLLCYGLSYLLSIRWTRFWSYILFPLAARRKKEKITSKLTS